MINKALFEKLYAKIDALNKRQVSLQRFYYSVEFNLKNTPLTGKTVLDLGCGSGTFSLYAALVANAQKVIALDKFEGCGASALNYKTLRSLLKIYNLTDIITLIKADGLTYEFNEKPFDVIYCSYVLHHLFPKTGQNKEATIIEFLTRLKSLLSRGGIILVQEVMRHNIAEYLPRWSAGAGSGDIWEKTAGLFPPPSRFFPDPWQRW